jgi:hypothetical protein
MSAGVKFGFLIGLLIVVCEILPQPLGLSLYWALGAGELTTGAVLTWRRTRLPFATAGMVSGAVASLMLLGVNLAGYPWPPPRAASNLPLPWTITVVALLVAVPLTSFAEAWVHRPAWRQWKEHMEHQGLWDLLCFRHIPVIRDRHGSST